MKKYYLALVATVIVAGAALVFFYRTISHKQPAPYREVIDDSLRIIRDNIKIHHDSGVYWNAQHQMYLVKKDSVDRLRGTELDRLRDSLRARVRADVAAEVRRSPDR